jgi:hypothetical protein
MPLGGGGAGGATSVETVGLWLDVLCYASRTGGREAAETLLREGLQTQLAVRLAALCAPFPTVCGPTVCGPPAWSLPAACLPASLPGRVVRLKP